MKAAAPFWDAPGATPPYIRIESSLLRAFPGYPKVTPPASAATKGTRIYQLRVYQSPTNMDHVRKVEMFHNGEFGFFAKAGAAGVFYADTLVGPNMPNLTYMLSFPDMQSLEADWEKFSADPDWKKLSADSQVQLRPANRIKYHKPRAASPGLFTGLEDEVIVNCDARMLNLEHLLQQEGVSFQGMV